MEVLGLPIRVQTLGDVGEAVVEEVSDGPADDRLPALDGGVRQPDLGLHRAVHVVGAGAVPEHGEVHGHGRVALLGRRERVLRRSRHGPRAGQGCVVHAGNPTIEDDRPNAIDLKQE